MDKNAAQHYLEKQILNATPAERIVLLYDGAIRFLSKSCQAIDEANIQERYNNNKKAGDIIAYLLETLDKEKGGEIADNLEKLYFYMLNRLMEADIKNSKEPIDDVVGKLRTLRASWAQLASGDAVGEASAAKGEDDTTRTEKRSAIA